MQKQIQPNYNTDVIVQCACGASMHTGSVVDGPIKVEICSNCHPFYTGEKKLVDTEGRVEKFERKMKKAEEHKTSQIEKAPSKKEKKTHKGALSLRDLLQQTR